MCGLGCAEYASCAAGCSFMSGRAGGHHAMRLARGSCPSMGADTDLYLARPALDLCDRQARGHVAAVCTDHISSLPFSHLLGQDSLLCIYLYTLTITYSQSLLITCTCCYDQIKGTQDKDFSYSFSDSLSHLLMCDQWNSRPQVVFLSCSSSPRFSLSFMDLSVVCILPLDGICSKQTVCSPQTQSRAIIIVHLAGGRCLGWGSWAVLCAACALGSTAACESLQWTYWTAMSIERYSASELTAGIAA